MKRLLSFSLPPSLLVVLDWVGRDDIPSLFPDAMTTVVRDSSPIKVSLAKLSIYYVVWSE